MPVRYANNASATLASALTISSTSLTVSSGGDLFPALNAGEWFYATLVRTTGEIEIVKVTARTLGSNTMTIVRGQDSTPTPITFSIGDKVEARQVAAALANMHQLDRSDTLSGNNTYSGNNTHSGANTFSGNNNFAGSQAFASITISTAATLAGRNIDAFPSGTITLFQQTAAPVGWTKLTTYNDRALRIVSGTAGAGGSLTFSGVFSPRTISQSMLPNVTLNGTTNNENAVHNHAMSVSGGTSNGGGNYPLMTGNNGGVFQFYTTGSESAPHAHTFTTSSINGGVAQTNLDFSVAYVDVILAQKN